MPDNELNGAPGTIRTSDPQIRSLRPFVDSFASFCKLTPEPAIVDQQVTTPVANQLATPPDPEKRNAAPEGSRDGAQIDGGHTQRRDRTPKAPAPARTWVLIEASFVNVFPTKSDLLAFLQIQEGANV